MRLSDYGKTCTFWKVPDSLGRDLYHVLLNHHYETEPSITIRLSGDIVAEIKRLYPGYKIL